MRLKPFLSVAAAAEIARRLKQSVSEAELDGDTRGVEPFIRPTDHGEMRTLKERCSAALSRAFRGPPERNEYCAILAKRIVTLSAMRRFQGGKASGRIIREVLIKHEAAWLAPALLEAAEQGQLTEIARLIDRTWDRDPINRGQYRVIRAYVDVLEREKRAPLIGELLRELGINKPKRTEDNMQEWLRMNSRERVIREVLKELDLPLSPGKRGRPR